MRKLSIFSVLLSTVFAASAADFSFALWGDMPYGKNNDARQTQAVIDSINASDVAFSIFDGDFKDGSSTCHDALYTQTLNTFNAMHKPLVYVPGDNEWTDCHRTNNGGFNALERLSLIRRTFFASSESLGQKKMRLAQQGKAGDQFSENTRFVYQGIVFVGLNVPGSNNNLVMSPKECTHKSARTQADCDAANAEFIERDNANVAWLKAAFATAKSQSARGVVVVIQANPGFDLSETWPLDESTLPEYSGYRHWMSALVAETEGFSGQVLLVHGDDHFFKIDKPLYSPLRMLKNFTRVQTFGSPSNHWVKVTVEGSQPQVFTLQPVMVEGH
ncbi:hypothetical protein [Limnohabitans sp. JirII-31]|uniref:hypothetical protein n=1 Tax=Limnohabitans sp. JirII-31 TaxID=1977908 RepID=UPI000C1E0EA5|nr:hypothetical protein [Limnohabitans sp. JirII-31]PIT74263.1 hypothetical protein B9Z41_13410 [Limnohabitans sp. JirII-31]